MEITEVSKECGNINESISKIVEYMWRNEFNDWEELGNPENHIFHAINKLKNYLYLINKEGKHNDDSKSHKI